MSGFMGIGKYGLLTMVGFCGFFYSLSWYGPEKPKFLLDREILETIAQYQPGLKIDHYDKSKH